MADIFAALYFHVLSHDPERPQWEERDRFVLSNGHICPVLYATLAHAGYFPREELSTLRKFGSRLQGHPHRTALPGLETSSGPLGSGLSQAVGMALVGAMDGSSWTVYCAMSDGEQEAGQTWEAALLAGKHKLANLTAVIDRNTIQIDGPTEKVMPLEPLKEKYEAFGWKVLEVDGHNIREFAEACEKARAIVARPVCIIAHTIPGKGVDFMEFDYRWHGSPPGSIETERAPTKKLQGREALRQLRTLGGKIEASHLD
jgi:transketolase